MINAQARIEVLVGSENPHKVEAKKVRCVSFAAVFGSAVGSPRAMVFSAPADRAEAENERLAGSIASAAWSLVRRDWAHRGLRCERESCCQKSPTGRGLSTPRWHRRCGRRSAWRKIPSGRGRAIRRCGRSRARAANPIGCRWLSAYWRRARACRADQPIDNKGFPLRRNRLPAEGRGADRTSIPPDICRPSPRLVRSAVLCICAGRTSYVSGTQRYPNDAVAIDVHAADAKARQRHFVDLGERGVRWVRSGRDAHDVSGMRQTRTPDRAVGGTVRNAIKTEGDSRMVSTCQATRRAEAPRRCGAQTDISGAP